MHFRSKIIAWHLLTVFNRLQNFRPLYQTSWYWLNIHNDYNTFIIWIYVKLYLDLLSKPKCLSLKIRNIDRPKSKHILFIHKYKDEVWCFIITITQHIETIKYYTTFIFSIIKRITIYNTFGVLGATHSVPILVLLRLMAHALVTWDGPAGT